MGKDEDRRLWDLVHRERAALIEDLAALPDEHWDTASLCAGWSVHDVTAHLVANADFRWRDLVLGLPRARFNFDRMNQQDMESRRGPQPSDTLSALRRVATSTATPPVARASRLAEEVLHGEDIRRPLGLTRAYPLTAVLPALEYQLTTPDSLGGARKRLGDVRLVATDADWSRGRGPEVRGPALELLMLAGGRGAAARDLEGTEHLGSPVD